jgi:hypothetical protein
MPERYRPLPATHRADSGAAYGSRNPVGGMIFQRMRLDHDPSHLEMDLRHSTR